MVLAVQEMGQQEEGAEEESELEPDPEVEEAVDVFDWVALGLCVL